MAVSDPPPPAFDSVLDAQLPGSTLLVFKWCGILVSGEVSKRPPTPQFRTVQAEKGCGMSNAQHFDRKWLEFSSDRLAQAWGGVPPLALVVQVNPAQQLAV